MKISIVIPVYNGEKWIAQCLDNVLSQSYKDLEVIVVDDGSRDATAAIAAGYPVRLIGRANGGVSAARNAGIDAATGDYIHFMDVDDLINLDYYRNMAEVALLTGADMVYGGHINEATPRFERLFSEKWFVSTPEDKFRLTNVSTFGNCWSYLIRRSFVEKAGLRFEEGRTHGEDFLFSIAAVGAAAGIATVPGAVYHYKNRAGSAMRSHDPAVKLKKKQDTVTGRAAQRELLARFGLPEEKTAIGSRPAEKTQYKLLGIPVAEKIVTHHGKTRWYVLGLRVVQAKQKF